MKNMRVEWQKIILPCLIAVLCFTGDSFGVTKRPRISLAVTDKTERHTERTEAFNGDGDVDKTTDMETEVCTLTVKIKNGDIESQGCQLKWYFLSENLENAQEKAKTIICSSGKKNLFLMAGAAVEEEITSDPFVFTSIGSDGDGEDERSGDVCEGYIVLITSGADVLAKKSNSSRYLKEEWIEKCRQVQ
ncbi:MAG: hypothetical protein JEZ10_06625 [Verrucomicrobia bacterium]|nr:hypothetical protein [Verrucomicrobiota bacterium]